MKMRLKVAALVGVVLFGLLAIVPLATAPVAKEDFQACADNGVCFTVLLDSEEATSPAPLGAGIETWLYVTNPSIDLTRPPNEDTILVEALTTRITDPEGTLFTFVFTPESPEAFAERFDTTVRPSETRRVFFVGWNLGFGPPFSPLGFFQFEYELALTFRGDSFTLAVDFELELVSLS